MLKIFVIFVALQCAAQIHAEPTPENIVLIKLKDGYNFCNGVILREKNVLTTAKCIKALGSNFENLESMKVVGSNEDLTNKITTTDIQDGSDEPSKDIGLIHLSTELTSKPQDLAISSKPFANTDELELLVVSDFRTANPKLSPTPISKFVLGEYKDGLIALKFQKNSGWPNFWGTVLTAKSASGYDLIGLWTKSTDSDYYLVEVYPHAVWLLSKLQL